MPEVIGTNSDAATVEIFNKLVGIFLVFSLYIFNQFNLVYHLLLKFACFQSKHPYIRCVMIVLNTLLIMQILIDWFCPMFDNNLLPYSPRSFYELFIQLFVVEIILWFIETILEFFFDFFTNRCYRLTMIILYIILSICLMFYNTCATLNVIFIMLKDLEQLY